MIMSLFRKDPAVEAAEALYGAAVEQARSALLYELFGAPDTVEGRFEQVALHVYLIMRGLKMDAAQTGKVSQKLFDVMFQDMDDCLREQGVGDLSVGKKIRTLGESFFGRIRAYEEALAEATSDDALVKALGRNVFADETAPGAKGLAVYVRAVAQAISEQPAARIAGGIVVFPAVKG